jgi:hypothetical protein
MTTPADRLYATVKIVEGATAQRSALKYSYQQRPPRSRGPIRLSTSPYPTATSVSHIAVCHLDYLTRGPVTRWFCTGCGSQLMHRSPTMGEDICVQTGNIDAFIHLPIGCEGAWTCAERGAIVYYITYCSLRKEQVGGA